MATTRHFWPMSGLVSSTSSSATISASTAWHMATFVASKTGTIDRVVLRTGTVTGTSPVYQVRVETLTAGNPSGTLISTNSSATFTPTTNTTTTVTLTSGASVTRGQMYAVVLRYSSGTIDASNNCTFTLFNAGNQSFNATLNAPVYAVSSNSGTSWTRTADSVSAMVPLYSDNDAEIWQCAIIAQASHNLNTGGITDIGTRFTAPLSATCVGAIFSNTISAANLAVLRLLDMSGTELAAQAGVQSTSNPGVMLFASPVTVTDGTEYRLVFSAASGSNLSISRFQFTGADARSACCGDAYYTSRTGSTWTDITDTAPICVPLFASPTSSGSSIAFNPVQRLPC